MAGKAALKRAIIADQGGLCALSGEKLPPNLSLVDTDRKKQKKDKGTYTTENTRVVTPKAHMKRHKTLRYREPELEALKSVLDDREQVRKLAMKISNQMLAFKRHTDQLNSVTLAWLVQQSDAITKELHDRDAVLRKAVTEYAKDKPFFQSMLGVHGIGPITVAYCAVYIDLSKARHASCLWSYTGLAKASHERYTKKVAGGGCKTLRTALYTMADSQLKTRGAYRAVYDNVKARLEQSDRIVKTRTTDGDLVEVPWKDAMLSHRHGAGIRAIMKHFLADYWMAGRKFMGLPVGPLYPEAMLGGTHRTIQPEERGWVVPVTE